MHLKVDRVLLLALSGLFDFLVFLDVGVVEVGQDVVFVLEVVLQEGYFCSLDSLELNGECLIVDSGDQHVHQHGLLLVVLLIHAHLFEFDLVLFFAHFDILGAFVFEAL